MKKKLCIVLCLAMRLSLCGCSKKGLAKPSNTQPNTFKSKSTAEIEMTLNNSTITASTTVQQLSNVLDIDLDVITDNNAVTMSNEAKEWRILNYPSLSESTMNIEYLYNTDTGNGRVGVLRLFGEGDSITIIVDDKESTVSIGDSIDNVLNNFSNNITDSKEFKDCGYYTVQIGDQFASYSYVTDTRLINLIEVAYCGITMIYE